MAEELVMPASLEASAARPPSYRALILLPDGTVVDAQPLIAADDEEALAMAQAMVNGHAVELWDGLRYIDRFDTLHTAL